MRRYFSVAPVLALISAAVAAACDPEDSPSTFDPQADSGSDAAYFPDVFQGPWADFPKDPIIVTADGGVGAPANSKELFGDPSSGAPSGGPCLVEPEVDSLYPNNWLRPRFRWYPSGGDNLFELRLHVENQINDLVVYTASTSWTMPQDMWDKLRAHSADVPMTVSIRGGTYESNQLTGIALGEKGPLGIAPAEAPGSVVYWTTRPDPVLKGFKVGDESVVTVLTPPQVKERPGSTCIGCHTSSPDGKYAAFQILEMGSNYYNFNSIAAVEPGQTGEVPPFLTAAAKAALNSYTGVPTLTPAHWQPGDRMEILSHTGELRWINLEGATPATASGVLPRGPKDKGKATVPSWGRDGETIVYVSTEGNLPDGRPANGPMDLYIMHYKNRQGGDATPLVGAAEPNFNEYYPAISPDGNLVAFNRVPSTENVYDNPKAEVFVIPTSGGTPTRLAANDPPACTKKKSPGVTNSWPKWAPKVETINGRSYYWVVFSSRRADDAIPQLYVTAVVTDANGGIKTHKALYLWNQPNDESNHTPAWDVFHIPEPPPR